MKNDRIILIIMCLTFLFILVNAIKNSIDLPICGEALEFYQNNINSKVIDKYIDYENHALQVITLSNEKKEFRFVEGNSESIIYKKVSIGDTIKKNSNSSFLEIIRNGQVKYQNHIHFFRCDSIELSDYIIRGYNFTTGKRSNKGSND